jgi:chromosomal replication initiation ATPase DnaA
MTSRTAPKSQQLRLPFPEAIGSFEDLAITDANRAAIEAIRKWPQWQSAVLCLIGPVQSGLGVTAKLWARDADAIELSARAFDQMNLADVEAVSHRNCVIDLADQVTNEESLLTLFNLARSKGTRLLLTARGHGAGWPCQSLDLRSRLETMPIAEIYPPDEEMIKARLLASCKGSILSLAQRRSIIWLFACHGLMKPLKTILHGSTLR